MNNKKVKKDKFNRKIMRKNRYKFFHKDHKEKFKYKKVSKNSIQQKNSKDFKKIINLIMIVLQIYITQKQ